MALLSALAAFATIIVTCAFWIATGWPDGSAAPMMAAVACCFFASQDDPAPHIMQFATSALIGTVGAGIYLFALLPLATRFEMLALALAPGLILCGLAMSHRRWAPIGLGAAVFGSTTLAIQNGYSGDFIPFINSAIAVVLGLWIAALVTRLMRSVEIAWSARRLRRINRRCLVRAATRHGADDGLELAALMLDRVGLIATRLTALPPEELDWTGELLTEVRVGINIVELRRARHGLPKEAKAAIDDILVALARHFRRDTTKIPDELLAKIDKGLAQTAGDPTRADSRAALLGLFGLRRALFPSAASEFAPSLPARASEVMA